ncbi:MAG: ATP-binding protein [bacterium]
MLQKKLSYEELKRRNQELERKLSDALNLIETLRAGQVDTISAKKEKKILPLFRKEIDRIYRTLLESMNEGLIAFDLDGLITFTNKKITQMLGYTHPDDLIGKEITEFLSPSNRKKVQDKIAHARVDKSTSTYELEFDKKEGSIPILINQTPLLNKKKEVDSLYWTITDLSQLKKAFSKIQVKSMQLARLYEISTDMVKALNLDERLRLILNATEELMQATVTSLMLINKETNKLKINVANGISDEVIKETALEIGQEIAGWVVNEKKPVVVANIEEDPRFRRPNLPRYKTRSFISVPLILEDEVLGVLNCTDKKTYQIFTEEDLELMKMVATFAAVIIKNTELFDNLQRAKSDLEKLDQLKSDFVSSVSHELRTPLTTIKQFTSLISREIPGKINSEQREYLQIISGNIDRLTRIINDLLDISKIEAGRIQLNRAFCDLVTLIHQTTESLRPQVIEKKISMRLLLPKYPLEAYIDPDRITQVLINLLGNALKFTPEGGKIIIKVAEKDQDIEVMVSDTGIGIAKEDLPKIFDKFTQFGREPSERPKGTGLGLAITKHIIEMHRGRIWASSRPAQGSKFTFSLPKYDEEAIFKEHLSWVTEKAKREHTLISLIIMKVSNFTQIQERYGKEEGWKVLKEIEEIAQRTVRRGDDIVVGYQKGKLVAILAETHKDGALAIQQRTAENINVTG